MGPVLACPHMFPSLLLQILILPYYSNYHTAISFSLKLSAHILKANYLGSNPSLYHVASVTWDMASASQESLESLRTALAQLARAKCLSSGER